MAKKKEEDRKPWQEMTYYELDYDALYDHAESLGGERGIKAVDLLDELELKKVEFTEEMKEQERKKLRKKMKHETRPQTDEYGNEIKDKDTGEVITKRYKTDERLYTDREIEEMLNEKKTVPMSFLKIKGIYCEEYYREIMPEREPKDESELTPAQKRAAKRAAIKERLRAGITASAEAEASATGGKGKK